MKSQRVILLEREDFLARKGEAEESPEGVLTLPGLTKLVTPDFTKVEGEDLTLRFVISDEQSDRDRDTIRVAGWNLKHYKKNPVVLWAHNSSEPPIARASEIGPDGDKLLAKATFTPRDVSPFGFMVHQMLDQKFLNAVSVGFKPEKWEFVDETDTERRGGINFLKQELLEFSVVPIPANPRALMRAHENGIDLSPLTAWCVRFLDLDPKQVKVAARQEIEATWKKLAERKTYVEVEFEAEPDTEKDDSLLAALYEADKAGCLTDEGEARAKAFIAKRDAAPPTPFTPEQEAIVKNLVAAAVADALKSLALAPELPPEEPEVASDAIDFAEPEPPGEVELEFDDEEAEEKDGDDELDFGEHDDEPEPPTKDDARELLKELIADAKQQIAERLSLRHAAGGGRSDDGSK